MKFNLDDYLSSSDSEEIVTFDSSSDKESLVEHKIENEEDKNEEDYKLDPTVESQIAKLIHETDKLPYSMNELSPLTINRVEIMNHKQTPLASTYFTNDDNKSTNNDTKIINSLSVLLSTKLQIISKDNNKQIEFIREEKRRTEEERLRKLERAKQEKLKREAEARRKAEAEAKAKEEARLKAEKLSKEQAAKLAQEEAARTKKELLAKQKKEASAKYITNFDNIEKTFWHYKQRIQTIKDEIVLPIKNAKKPIKSPIMTQKRKINPKFGQLTHSWKQLQLIENELIVLINQTREHSDIAYQWILNFVAKAIVHQSESEISVKPENSLPLARLTTFLLNQYPELSDFLISRFVKKCPFVIGFTCSIDTEQGRNNMGWKRNSEQIWETDTTYDERMNGMITLYSVITRLNEVKLPNEIDNKIWNINAGWTFVARMANLPINLLTNTHFVILGSWWDASALQFLQTYGNQGRKLLEIIANDMTVSVSDKRFVGAARLRILMEEWQDTGIIKSFPEMNP